MIQEETCQSLSTLNSDPFFCCRAHWVALPWKRISPLRSCLSTSITATADRTRLTSKIKGHIRDAALPRPDALHELRCIPQTPARLVSAFKKSREKSSARLSASNFPITDERRQLYWCCLFLSPLLPSCLSPSVSFLLSLSISISLDLSLSLPLALFLSLSLSFLRNQ